MPKEALRPAIEIAKSISAKSNAVRNAANALSERIRLFEEYLSTLPGRVEAYTYGAHPDDNGNGELELGLRLHRDGNDWVLSYCSYHQFFNEQPENPIEWKPLREAPLKLKIASVNLFPDLLQAIEKSQDQLIKEINEAATTYDDFASSLGNATTKSGEKQSDGFPNLAKALGIKEAK